MHTESVRSWSWVYALAILLGEIIGVAFLYALSVYWKYFRMGSGGGPAMFAIYIGFPISAMLACVVSVLTIRRARRRSVRPLLALGRSVVLVSCVFALLLASEMWRTRNYPNDDPSRTMSGYLLALVHR